MNVSTLTWELYKASAQSSAGNRLVTFLAITAITVGSFVAFLLAGGTWMFYQRYLHPEQLSPTINQMGGVGEPAVTWVGLAIFACVFVVPSLISLTSQAAVVGASGRERRLAALRLVGLSSGDITRMTAMETGLQAVIGIVLGLFLSLLSLPLFGRLKFQDTQVRIEELVLPWWGYISVALFLFVLAIAASFIGMQRVRVSPLGVARREMPKALRWWRLVIFVVVVAVGFYFINTADLALGDFVPLLFMGFMLFIMVSALNVVMPWILQVVSLMLSLLPGTSHYVACRRIATNGRAAWKRSSAIAFFGVIAGYLVVSPFGNDGLTAMFEAEKEASLIFGDLARGGLLTLGFGFLIFAVSTFLGQTSEIFEKADLARSMARLGVSKSFHFRVSLVEVMGPILLVSLGGLVFGAAIGFMMLNQAGEMDVPARLLTSLSFLSAGWAVSVLALVLAVPLRNGVIDMAVRKND